MQKNKMSKSQRLNQLKSDCEKCFACELSKTRNNIVFADGNPDSASIVLIGEAPGENEDLKGIPFVGRAGKLLDEFFAKAGLSRENDIYIINTVKCRPPKNRVPTEYEKKACRNFLEAQINIINPKIILLCGATAMKSFLSSKSAISKVRGDVLEVDIDPSPEFSALDTRAEIQPSPSGGEGSEETLIASKKFKVMPIFHPSYLLRNHSLEENSPRDLMLKDLKKVKNLI